MTDFILNTETFNSGYVLSVTGQMGKYGSRCVIVGLKD